MTSNRPKHIEPSSTDSTSGDTIKARALETSSAKQSDSAIKQVQQHIQAGYRHCVDMDLAKFFDKVQHDVLLARVSRKVHDKRLLGLIGRYLRAGIMVDGLAQSTSSNWWSTIRRVAHAVRMELSS